MQVADLITAINAWADCPVHVTVSHAMFRKQHPEAHALRQAAVEAMELVDSWPEIEKHGRLSILQAPDGTRVQYDPTGARERLSLLVDTPAVTADAAGSAGEAPMVTMLEIEKQVSTQAYLGNNGLWLYEGFSADQYLAQAESRRNIAGRVTNEIDELYLISAALQRLDNAR